MAETFNPKVSVIVPIYKTEPFLDKLILSLIHQTYRNIEIILVDDGSPDISGEICDKYAAYDDRIRVIHKENGGTSNVRNAGMKIMTGDYLTFVDGDDWCAEDCIEYLMSIVAETGAEMAMSNKIFTTRDMTQTKDDRIETWTPEDDVAAILYPTITVGPWNKIYSTDMLRKNNMSFTNLWFGEGLMFSCEAAQHSNRVGVGHRKVYVYRMNNLNSGLTKYNV